MTAFVLVPGMNHGAWWYRPLVDRLVASGHHAVAVTPTGLEPEPDLDRAINLDTHVADVLAALDTLTRDEGERLVLVGHSYGGLLISAAADQRPGQVSGLVFLDAFLPEDGETAWSLTNDEQRAWYVGDAGQTGLAVAPLPFFDDQARPHPIATLLQAVRLTGAWRDVETTIYVEALEWPTETPMRTSIDRAERDPDIDVRHWQTRHNVMHDGTDRVFDLLTSIG